MSSSSSPCPTYSGATKLSNLSFEACTCSFNRGSCPWIHSLARLRWNNDGEELLVQTVGYTTEIISGHPLQVQPCFIFLCACKIIDSLRVQVNRWKFNWLSDSE
jgi:hypothetical protein